MSIVSVTSRHTVQLLNPVENTGDQFGRDRQYEDSGNTRLCTLVPFNSNDPEMLMERQAVIPFTVYFHRNPNVNENHRFRRNGIDARLLGVARNAHGQNRLWIIRGEVRREDNPLGDLQDFFDA